MAIWQYTFQILPKESVEFLSSDYYLEKKGNVFDVEPYWIYNPINKNIFQPFQNILPKNKSWSKDIELYGIQDSNCIEVLFDKKCKVLSASFRIDIRGNYEEFLNQIIQFCIINCMVILSEEIKFVTLNSELIKKIIEESPQTKRYNEFYLNIK